MRGDRVARAESGATTSPAAAPPTSMSLLLLSRFKLLPPAASAPSCDETRAACTGECEVRGDLSERRGERALQSKIRLVAFFFFFFKKSLFTFLAIV